MNIKYGKIFDLNMDDAEELQNTSYLEELTGLIEKTAARIDSDTNYYFDDKYYLNKLSGEKNSSYNSFITSIKDSFDNSSSDKVHIIRGRAGIGKTLFFNKGVQKLLRDQNDNIDKYIELGVDFKNIDQKKDVKFYVNYIYDNLRNNAIDSIRQLGLEIYRDFIKEKEKYIGEIEDTPFAKLFPVMYFCNRIFKKYSKPCIIILDNIDLACVKTQINVFKATSIVCEKLHKFMATQNLKDIYRVYFAMRPETFLHSEEMKIGKVINFPLPNIQTICLEMIKDEIINIAKSLDEKENLKCEVTYYSIITNNKETAKTFLDVANYFSKIFSYFLNDLWNDADIIRRLGTNETFHCNIVNYNIRTFLSFLSDTLSNGGFKPLTKEFNKNPYGGHFGAFDYVEMVIRGRWKIHPGNLNIDGEGGNKAPIVFNVFDTSLWTNTQQCKLKHFMLNIRILQYFSLYSKGEKRTYEFLEKNLSYFFDKEEIMKAVQELTFVRILYSSYEGDENIASKRNWYDVVIEIKTELYLSPSGIFYLEKFICEFEYLHQMALSSIMPISSVEELSKLWKTEKELVVLHFLKGIYYIIKDNLEQYDDALSNFKKIFCKDDELNCRPYRRMLNSFIEVMKNKINHAENKGIKSFDKLCDILVEAECLQNEATDYFIKKVGDEL